MKKTILLSLIISLMLCLNTVNSISYAAESAFDLEEGTESSSAFASGGGFGDSFSYSQSPLSFTGSLKYYTRAILDIDGESDVSSEPSLDLDLGYEKDSSEMKVKLDLADSNTELEEAYIRLYYDKFNILVGKKKVVWGKGDDMHVVDNLNALDFSDFVNPDYMDRKIAEEMIKLNYYLGTGSLELVYTPEFTTNKAATSGNWVMPSSQQENITIKQAHELDDGQLAVRYTNSHLGYDYGFSLYQGRLRQPSWNRDKKKLDYDRVIILGTEFSSVLAGINSRAELAYYLTEDTNGDDPYVHNNRLAWVIGGDKNLPINNMNVNIQLRSELILDDEQIISNRDVDYNKNDEYLSNTIALGITDSFKHEMILPEFSLAYNVEDEDYMINNSVEFILKDDTSLTLSYKLFGGDDDTMFGQFSDNDYLSAEFKYDF